MNLIKVKYLEIYCFLKNLNYRKITKIIWKSEKNSNLNLWNRIITKKCLTFYNSFSCQNSKERGKLIRSCTLSLYPSLSSCPPLSTTLSLPFLYLSLPLSLSVPLFMTITPHATLQHVWLAFNLCLGTYVDRLPRLACCLRHLLWLFSVNAR